MGGWTMPPTKWRNGKIIELWLVDFPLLMKLEGIRLHEMQELAMKHGAGISSEL